MVARAAGPGSIFPRLTVCRAVALKVSLLRVALSAPPQNGMTRDNAPGHTAWMQKRPKPLFSASPIVSLSHSRSPVRCALPSRNVVIVDAPLSARAKQPFTSAAMAAFPGPSLSARR
ncbi:hypothetical protein P171DRAFT_245562 [Karstenula rhodostoma CBS 690.94]|uniref:Uncharacterized protein n=1 Tax=Karstenula rhodostoma CBS 690.94 TaxID=1392251 RepID=A0A9P4UFC3_9PLEO|nr:hypothetical protein P171DRAFT_245562 [Karstenula rhodostoma CBS 690.94]